MKAKICPRIRTEDRTPLQEVIPLETPLHIFVDPSAACNFRCRFCFNRDKSKTFHKMMDYALFENIVNDLKQFPNKLKVLRLYKEGEPLMNKRLPDMIACARSSDVCEKIDFTTNGSLLTPERSIQLINSGLDAMIVSVSGITDEKYLEVTDTNINFKEYVENIKHFYNHRGNCRLHIKTTDVNVPEEDREEFFNIFGDICDEISIDAVTPIWPGIDLRDIKEDFDRGIYNQEIAAANICPYIFYSFTINSDGSVSSCFIDWEHSNIVGDVNVESVYDIWHGKKMLDLRRAHLESQRDNYNICRDCGQLRYGMPDNIDRYADALRLRLEERYNR